MRLIAPKYVGQIVARLAWYSHYFSTVISLLECIKYVSYAFSLREGVLKC